MKTLKYLVWFYLFHALLGAPAGISLIFVAYMGGYFNSSDSGVPNAS